MSATSGPLDHEAEMAGYDARSEKEGGGEGEGEKKIGDVGGVGGERGRELGGGVMEGRRKGKGRRGRAMEMVRKAGLGG